MHVDAKGKLSSSRINTTCSVIFLLFLLAAVACNVCLKNTEHIPVLIESVCALIAAVLGVRAYQRRVEGKYPVDTNFDRKIFTE